MWMRALTRSHSFLLINIRSQLYFLNTLILRLLTLSWVRFSRNFSFFRNLSDVFKSLWQLLIKVTVPKLVDLVLHIPIIRLFLLLHLLLLIKWKEVGILIIAIMTSSVLVVVVMLNIVLTFCSWIRIFCLKTFLIAYLWILITLYIVSTILSFKLWLRVYCFKILIHLILLWSWYLRLSLFVSSVISVIPNRETTTVFLFFGFIIKSVGLILFWVIRVSVQWYKII